MGRWTQYDEDDHRLPEGIKRIAYDADTGRYYFRDHEGLVYKGPEGARFGGLTQVAQLPVTLSAEGGDNGVEAAPAHGDGYPWCHKCTCILSRTALRAARLFSRAPHFILCTARISLHAARSFLLTMKLKLD